MAETLNDLGLRFVLSTIGAVAMTKLFGDNDWRYFLISLLGIFIVTLIVRAALAKARGEHDG